MQHRTAHRGYYIPEVQTKDYNLMVDGTNAFDQRMQIDQIMQKHVITLKNF